jgi:hypothetical protein
MSSKVDVNFDGLERVIDRLSGDNLRISVTEEILRQSHDYAPFKQGELANSGHSVDSGKALEYNTPYARYDWYGKLYVDPITGKGAFHDPQSGRFWSRPNVQKVPTDRDLNFNGAPKRGSHWVERAWIEKKDEILDFAELQILKGGKK